MYPALSDFASSAPMPVDTSAPASRLEALRHLLPLLRPYRGLIAGWLGFLALSSTATLSLPVAVRYMIDRGFGGDDPGAIDRWFAGLFGVALLLAAATAARFFFVSLLGERVAADRSTTICLRSTSASMSAPAAASWCPGCRRTLSCCVRWSARPPRSRCAVQ
jgi:hypothetical protein